MFYGSVEEWDYIPLVTLASSTRHIFWLRSAAAASTIAAFPQDQKILLYYPVRVPIVPPAIFLLLLTLLLFRL